MKIKEEFRLIHEETEREKFTIIFSIATYKINKKFEYRDDYFYFVTKIKPVKISFEIKED